MNLTKMNIKNVLITGGAGFIGSNLALQLLKKGYNVTVYDNLSPQIHGDNPDNSPLYQSIKNKVTFFKGCITDKENLQKAVEGQDVIVHYAADKVTGNSLYEI